MNEITPARDVQDAAAEAASEASEEVFLEVFSPVADQDIADASLATAPEVLEVPAPEPLWVALGGEDTKRRLTRDELDDTADTALVLEEAARARLLTLDDNRVEIAHEALIRCWSRLTQWLTEDRDRLLTHRRLTEATDIWESLDRDPGALYRGAPSSPRRNSLPRFSPAASATSWMRAPLPRAPKQPSYAAGYGACVSSQPSSSSSCSLLEQPSVTPCTPRTPPDTNATSSSPNGSPNSGGAAPGQPVTRRTAEPRRLPSRSRPHHPRRTAQRHGDHPRRQRRRTQ
ncbi:nSTAND1 domain-containing NTPase [Streptomyces cylindrosporus]|uniref:Novel STAND NTPase 1 domain-containing protein n=1 Tax=Streptomyces cylindrosporus TaxID=2927583 RepID=A0ABS9YIH7_9ACTN|nr:hypothetical protein [Streptomyces cylindrosporus]MCI3276990.1 hypothetical protein [Streptomyces cylindrosporus]